MRSGVRRGELPFYSILLPSRLFTRNSLLEELIERGSEFFEIVLWHGKSAGGADLVDMHKYNRSHTCYCIDSVQVRQWTDLLQHPSSNVGLEKNTTHFHTQIKTYLFSATNLSNFRVPYSNTSPLPHNLTILGGPSNAFSITVILPFPGSWR